MAKATRELSFGRIIYEIKRLMGVLIRRTKLELEGWRVKGGGEDGISLARGDINIP